MKVSEAVGRLLVERGVRQVFGLIGSGNFDITLAMVEAGASFASSRHEGGAITMTDAFGRASGEVAACSVHQGPGLTNTMTGLTEAVKSHTPLLLLAAETAAGATRSNFRIDQGRWSHRSAPASPACASRRLRSTTPRLHCSGPRTSGVR